MISIDEMHRIMPNAGSRVELNCDALNDAMVEFGISDNILREAAFIAQVAEESGELRYTHEIATGLAYEGRQDLGNIYPGDGVKYRGEGDLEITGRFNFTHYGELLGLDLVNHPEILQEPGPGARVAACFWQKNGLNELADKEDFLLITRRINGGANGYPARLAYYERAKTVLGGDHVWT